MEKKRLNEITGIALLAWAIIVLASLISYSPNDLSFYTSHPNIPAKNYIRIFGAYLSGIFFFLGGGASYTVPLLLLLWAIAKLKGRRVIKLHLKILGSIILFFSLSGLLSMVGNQELNFRFQKGGLFGLLVCDLLVRYFGRIGSYVILVSLISLSILLATELLIFPFISGIIKKSRLFFVYFLKKVRRSSWIAAPKKKKVAQPPLADVKPQKITPALSDVNKKVAKGLTPPPLKVKKGEYKEQTPKVPSVGDIQGYKLPSLNLLDSPPPIEERKIKDDLQANAGVLEGTLSDFGIEAKVVDIERGPVITRYELQPAAGVKVHRIASLSDDIALAMKAQSVRMVAPIPGKARVGVEVPNTQTTMVYLREVLETKGFQNSDSKLTLALGKDISGSPVIADLREMPHLLVAGTTGSGKTVCVNSLVTSILFEASPEEVKFLMADPKMVELAIFNDIPHLLCPVVTQPKKVQAALSWVVNEMEERYRLFAKMGARNIEGYNERSEKLPYIVVIIDELADLMAVASAEIENAITRLAQLSRAVGIHLVLATQRPSVDVVTGVIKANFPARISFKVASKVDSRTVLDINGADKLLGKGDMLFLMPGTSRPIRAQGSLIQDEEIERVVKFVRAQREPIYDEEILKSQEKEKTLRDVGKDELFDEAVKMVLETNQASVSMLQRRLRLGYTRAARLIDMMEEERIIGPYRGSRPREILVNKNIEKEETIE